MVFYKGVLKSFLKDIFIPGTVTVDFKTAQIWKERIGGDKSVIVEVIYDGHIFDHDEFQKPGVTEHEIKNRWTSASQDKVRIVTPCKYRILSHEEITGQFAF